MSSGSLISIVVVVFNMRREAARTLFSLSAKYQQDVTENDYEVIVVENGSAEPLTEAFVQSFGKNFRYYYIENAPLSPAHAINFGAKKAKGEIFGIMIDGARILTPGVIKYAIKAARTYPNPVIAVIGFHLGPEVQNLSMAKGYSREKEDELLASIDWAQNGYKLFEISCLAESCKGSWFSQIGESNCIFMKKESFFKLGGYDERFDLPGGGIVNLDTYARACEIPDSTLVFMLGEGAFHQLHSGICTNADLDKQRAQLKAYGEQYSKIRDEDYSKPTKEITYIGHIPKESIKFLRAPL